MRRWQSRKVHRHRACDKSSGCKQNVKTVFMWHGFVRSKCSGLEFGPEALLQPGTQVGAISKRCRYLDFALSSDFFSEPIDETRGGALDKVRKSEASWPHEVLPPLTTNKRTTCCGGGVDARDVSKTVSARVGAIYSSTGADGLLNKG